MNKIDIVRKAFSNSTPIEEQKTYFSDDYQYSDSTAGQSIDKKAWFTMGEMYRNSMPDGGFVIDEIHQEGDDVLCTGHFTGTFQHDLDLSAVNLGVIKATGKRVNIPPDTSRISFRGDKIYRTKNLSTGPNAGLAGFLSALRTGK